MIPSAGLFKVIPTITSAFDPQVRRTQLTLYDT
jgi:hypothetical protein